LDNDLVYKIALTQIAGIGPVNAKSLIAYAGSVKGVFKLSKTQLEKIPGIGSILAQNILSFNDFSKAEKEVEFTEKNGIKALFFLDKEYPYRLKNIPDAPIVLYTKGDVSLSPAKSIAVVGTRKMTEYGKHFLETFIEEVKAYQPTIISGLAYGVDITAHRLCVKHQLPTFGVVAHGLDRIYPAIHTSTAKKMVEQGGCLITELTSGSNPDRENFPKRNRIVAGMADVVIVVESAAKGGSLITAELGNQYNRDVMALPGATFMKYSKGCNYLIKAHKANVIESAEDLVKLMNWDVKKKETRQPELFVELNDTEEKIVEALRGRFEGVGIDEILLKTKLSSSALAVALLELEMKGLVTGLPGKHYKLLR
jgi:DNA processing protein